MLYGATITPNDLDVVPGLDQVNLGRLARMFDKLGAVPAHLPTWPESPSREQCWPGAPTLNYLYLGEPAVGTRLAPTSTP
ncbi:hypothetical protein GCM10009610_06160 [Pseudonocardia xinjiangensis]